MLTKAAILSMIVVATIIVFGAGFAQRVVASHGAEVEATVATLQPNEEAVQPWI